MTHSRLAFLSSLWTRRAWLTTTTAAAVQTSVLVAFRQWPARVRRDQRRPIVASPTAQTAPAQLEQWAQQAVEAARAAGARYADVRCTRTVQHSYQFGDMGSLSDVAAADVSDGSLSEEVEVAAVGVRALVHGYWGFAACPLWVDDPAGAATAVQLAQTAVAQAKANARGTARTVELGSMPVVTGKWTTPMTVDPFTISIEEKMETIRYWKDSADSAGLEIIVSDSSLRFFRQERVMVTSDGTRISQTCYESGGKIFIRFADRGARANVNDPKMLIPRIEMSGQGWERLADAKLPDEFMALPDVLRARGEVEKKTKPMQVGRRTLVCDGVTMAALVERTLGVATQLDRALGNEANAGGTSFIDDPLAMVGQLAVASPLVTVTANRSTPTQLATVQWDDEGVVPVPFSLVQEGVLVDFQTTREQAAWLTPYYQQHGRPVRSHGCAAAQDASYITLQHMPNLALTPSASAIGVEDLVHAVQDGLLIEEGTVTSMDFQGRTGMLIGRMREIRNGKVGRMITGGGVLFETTDLWKHVTAIGGAATRMALATTPVQMDYTVLQLAANGLAQFWPHVYKGQPGQGTSHSVQGVAATIANQAVVDMTRKG